jgi:hypothetical protein
MHLLGQAQGWGECRGVRGHARGVQHRRPVRLRHTVCLISEILDVIYLKELYLTAEVDPDDVKRLTGWSPNTSS